MLEPIDSLILEKMKDLKVALPFLKFSLQEGGLPQLLEALQIVAKAQGGISKLAARTGLPRQTLYRVLTKKGNPEAKSLWAVVEGMGIELTIHVPPAKKISKTARPKQPRRHHAIAA